MKKLFYIAIAMSILAFASCKDDSGIAPQAISELSYASDYGAVILTYKVPADSNFYYVDVSWTDAAGKPRRVQATVYAADINTRMVNVVCDGFSDTKDYLFTLTPYSLDGTPGNSQSITGRALPPAFEAVLETVEVIPGLRGVVVTWTNPTGKNIQVEVKYTEATPVSKTFSSPGDQTNGRALITGLAPGNKEFVIVTKDSYNNSSEEKQISVTVLADLQNETTIDKTGWSIPGYNSGSNNETIGYSSQAANEGAEPQGRAVALFDNTLSNFWHSSWGSLAPDYPHWVIIDLGREVTLSRFEMCKRQGGNTSMQKGYQLLTCTAAGTDYPGATIPNWTWIDQGTFAFDPTIDAMQSVYLVATPRARYIKLYFPANVKGADKFTMIAEVNAYGRE